MAGFFPFYDPVTGFPLDRRFNIPEVFGNSLSYLDQQARLAQWILWLRSVSEKIMKSSECEFDKLEEDIKNVNTRIDELPTPTPQELPTVYRHLNDYIISEPLSDGNYLITMCLSWPGGMLQELSPQTYMAPAVGIQFDFTKPVTVMSDVLSMGEFSTGTSTSVQLSIPNMPGPEGISFVVQFINDSIVTTPL